MLKGVSLITAVFGIETSVASVAKNEYGLQLSCCKTIQRN